MYATIDIGVTFHPYITFSTRVAEMEYWVSCLVFHEFLI